MRLIEAAAAARHDAYCPYSNFRVGAAVLTQDGAIVTGTPKMTYIVIIRILQTRKLQFLQNFVSKIVLFFSIF